MNPGAHGAATAPQPGQKTITVIDGLTGQRQDVVVANAPASGDAKGLSETSRYGAIPLFWGTIFIGAIIAMIVAIPLGLMSAIYLTQYAAPGVRRWVDSVKRPDAGRSAYGQRYIGAMVADFHRTLLRGGIFVYPPDRKNASGKLRLLYEASPLAFVCEQAGGSATDGKTAIRDVIPTELHRRIDQAMAVCGSDPERQAAGRRFVDLVASDRGRAIMRRYGFLLPGESLAEIR